MIGAGPTGVELAGVIAELAKKVLWPKFRNIDTRNSRVLLIEAGSRVLPAFPDDLSTYAAQALEKLGVEVKLSVPVSNCAPADLIAGLGDQRPYDLRLRRSLSLWASRLRLAADAP